MIFSESEACFLAIGKGLFFVLSMNCSRFGVIMKSGIIIPVALQTIELQASSISNLKSFVNEDFVKAVEQIAYSKGRLW
jgi:hypothetical protein